MEKLGKRSLHQVPQLMKSQRWKQKKSVLLSPWESLDRKLRLGQGQLTWETVGGTSGPLEEKGKLHDGYRWSIGNEYGVLTGKDLPIFYTQGHNLNV